MTAQPIAITTFTHRSTSTLPKYAYIILTTKRIPALEDPTMQPVAFGNHNFFVLRVDAAVGYESFGGQGINVIAAQSLGEAAGPVIQRHLEIDHGSHQAA